MSDHCKGSSGRAKRASAKKRAGADSGRAGRIQGVRAQKFVLEPIHIPEEEMQTLAAANLIRSLLLLPPFMGEDVEAEDTRMLAELEELEREDPVGAVRYRIYLHIRGKLSHL